MYFNNLSAPAANQVVEDGNNGHGPHERFFLDLLRVVPPHNAEKGISINEIEARLKSIGVERSKRTLQRAVAALQDNYLDIQPDGRSNLIKKKNLAGISFGGLSRQESFLLTLAYKQLDSMLPPSLKAGLKSLFDQAFVSMQTNQQAELDRQWLQKIYAANSTQPLIPKESHPGVLENVSNALYENHYLHVKYVNKVGLKREGDVMPLALVQQGNKMLLVCRCHAWEQSELQRDPRVKTPINWNLMLHRIVTAEVLPNRSFHYPKDFDVKEHERRGGFGIGNGQMVRLSFDMKREFALSLLETRLSTDQEHEDHGDWITIRATVADTFILDHWLRGFGEAVRNIVKADDSN